MGLYFDCTVHRANQQGHLFIRAVKKFVERTLQVQRVERQGPAKNDMVANSGGNTCNRKKRHLQKCAKTTLKSRVRPVYYPVSGENAQESTLAPLTQSSGHPQRQRNARMKTVQ